MLRLGVAEVAIHRMYLLDSIPGAAKPALSARAAPEIRSPGSSRSVMNTPYAGLFQPAEFDFRRERHPSFEIDMPVENCARCCSGGGSVVAASRAMHVPDLSSIPSRDSVRAW